jgi:hypothetical protein
MKYNTQYNYWVDQDYEDSIDEVRARGCDSETGYYDDESVKINWEKEAVMKLFNELYNQKDNIDKKNISTAMITLCKYFGVSAGYIEDIRDLDCMVIEHYKEKDREAERVKQFYRRELSLITA